MIDLQRILDELNLTQIELAALFDVHQSAISSVKLGRMKFPKAWSQILKEKYDLDIRHYEVNDDGKSDVLNEPSVEYSHTIPYYDAIATGSNKNVTVIQDGSNSLIGHINVGDLMPKAECVIRVAGNSMTPNYPSGCLIGLRKISDGLFDYGAVYVIETEDNRFVKRVFKGKEDTCIQLYSDNEQIYDNGARKGMLMYEPFQLPKSKIKRVFKVTGVVKLNDHSHIPD